MGPLVLLLCRLGLRLATLTTSPSFPGSRLLPALGLPVRLGLRFGDLGLEFVFGDLLQPVAAGHHLLGPGLGQVLQRLLLPLEKVLRGDDGRGEDPDGHLRATYGFLEEGLDVFGVEDGWEEGVDVQEVAAGGGFLDVGVDLVDDGGAHGDAVQEGEVLVGVVALDEDLWGRDSKAGENVVFCEKNACLILFILWDE